MSLKIETYTFTLLHKEKEKKNHAAPPSSSRNSMSAICTSSTPDSFPLQHLAPLSQNAVRMLSDDAKK
jgi:hypothetical protein